MTTEKAHIQQQYDHELEDVRSKVLAMGGLVEQQVTNGLKALLERDAELGEETANSDYKVNTFEVEIDEECAQIIARRQPTAGDLRLVLTIIKVITDLERIGDEAEKIGRYASKLASQPSVTGIHAELQHLGDLVINILHESLDVYARMDDEQAMKVVKYDKKINKEFDNLSRLLMTHMMEDPRNIKSALQVTWCARALERIGDHSKNICEYVIYRVKGKDVRHTSLKQIKEELYSAE